MPQEQRYQIQEPIGQGVITNVYKAFDPRTRRYIAIKMLRPEFAISPKVIESFLSEAKAVGRLAHPSIVSVYDVGEIDKRPYIAMELLSGQFLSEIVNSRNQLPWQTVVEIAKQLASALDYAHSHGVIHGDLKPANIAWSADEGNKVVITDFSVARLDKMCDEETIHIKQGPGIPKYVSPEQVLGNAVDNRSDLFSLGVILYQLLTGQKPFTADTLAELTEQYTKHKAQPISLIRPDLHNALIRIIEKLLEINPKGRYQDAKALLGDLEQFATAATQTQTAVSAKKSLGIYVISIVVLAITTGVIWYLVTKPPTLPKPDIANIDHSEETERKEDTKTIEMVTKPAESVALEESIATRLAGFECANLNVNVDSAQMVLISGYVSIEEDMLGVMDVVESLPGIDSVTYEITTMQWPFCEVASILSEDHHANVNMQSSLRIATESKLYDSQERLVVEIDAPAYDSYIYVDIYRADGSVFHLTPENHDKLTLTPATSQMFVSEKKSALVGNDENLVVVIAANTPLVIPRRPQREPAQNYLSILHKQIVVEQVKLSAKMLKITALPRS